MSSQPLATPFPNPPSFYTSFTPANLAALAALEAAAAEENPSGVALPSSALPPALRVLRPPTPPADGTYTVFGEERTLATRPPPIPAGERVLPEPAAAGTDTDADAEERHPPASPGALLQLTRSILLSYLELLHVLVAQPAGTAYAPKWEDLRDLFRNAHAVLAAYRGWQGRAALIALLEAQVQGGARADAQGRALEARVAALLAGMAGTKAEGDGDGDGEGGEQAGAGAEDAAGECLDRGAGKDADGEARRMWALLEAEAGA